MAESSSTQTQLPNMGFTIPSKDSMKLKFSISALGDSEFNFQGVAMVDVSEKGFGLTVRNAISKAVGNLFLKSSGLIDFHCNNPIAGKMISVHQFNEVLNSASREDSITVFHVDDSSNCLCFKIGSTPAKELSIGFLENDDEFEKFPDDIEFSCEAILMSSTLREMIKRLNDIQGLQLVSVNVAETQVSIFVNLKTPWSFVTNYGDENFEVYILTQEREHHAWFEWRHLGAMKKASILAMRFHLHFLTKPAGNYVMIRFSLEELGDMVFILKGILNIKKPDKISLDEDGAPRADQLARSTSQLMP